MASETPTPGPVDAPGAPNTPVKAAVVTPAPETPAAAPKSVAPTKVAAPAPAKPAAAPAPAPAAKPLAVLINPTPKTIAAGDAKISAASAAQAQDKLSDSSEAVKVEAPVEKTPHVLKSEESMSAAAKKPAFELPSAVYSPQLLEAVIYDIQYYLDWYRQNQIRKKVGAHPKDEPNHTSETVLVIEAWLAGQPATLEALEALLTYLHELKLPEVHITLAALPNRTQRESLVTWFRNNTKSALLVSFVADRNLGGGIVVRTPNHLFDFSWKQEFLASRDKLAGILKRV